MKTNNWKKLLMATLWLGMCAVPAMAQKNIDKIVEELEKRDDVEINVVTNRDPETRKVTKCIKSLTFKDEKVLKRLIEAYNKDEEYTTKAIKNSNIKAGKTELNYMYTFPHKEGKYNYALNTGKDGYVFLSIIFNPKQEAKKGKAVSKALSDSKDLEELLRVADEMRGELQGMDKELQGMAKEMQIGAQTSSDTLIQK